MGALLDRLNAEQPVLWLDYTEYAGALLSRGEIPWLDAIGLIAWYRKAQSLLGSDVIALPMGDLMHAWVGATAALRATMEVKRRVGFALKTVLADAALIEHLQTVVAGLRGNYPSLPLAVACPSPREWVRVTHQLIYQESIDVDEDAADAAAMQMAAFLRNFGTLGLDVLLLQESELTEPANPADLACYQAVVNVAALYGWDIGLMLPGRRYHDGTHTFQFLITPQTRASHDVGCVVPMAYWSGDQAAACQAARLRFASIPRMAMPERVLERIAQLKR